MMVNWLEILELRSAVYIGQDVIHRQIEAVLEEMKNENHIIVYINGQVETDWSIHVKHDSEKFEAMGSKVGRQLKEILKGFGLVNHKVWIQKEMSK